MTTTKHQKPTVKMDSKAMSDKMANATMKASFMNAALTDAFTKDMIPENNLGALTEALQENIKKVQASDMGSMEAMLVGQAQALQAIFVSLGRRAVAQTQLKQYGMYLTLALKAQSQSRATIQALTELKYPKQVSFVQQANIAHGNQQVNNGSHQSSTHTLAHTQENQTHKNKLLEGQQNEWLETRTATTPSRADKAMATVET